MSLSMNQMSRRAVFKIYDKIFKRGEISKIISELNSQYKSNTPLNAEKKIRTLIDHAAKTTNFYSQYQGSKDITDLPVIKKEDIKNNYDDFISNSFIKKDLIPVRTSGSYGTPMRFLLDNNKRLRRTVEVIYYNTWANYSIGMKHVLNAVGVHKSKLKLFFQNEIMVNPTKLEDDWLEKFRHSLKKRHVEFYVGYSSVIKEIAEYCLKKNDKSEDFSLKGIIATAEPLYENIRSEAEKVFGCPVLSRYAALEFGVLAQECMEGKKHHLNNAGYFIELLSLTSDKPVKRGESGRIVVTDLHSFAMPLIRYDIGDLAVKKDETCCCGRKGPVFESIEGRLVENIHDEKGGKISYVAVNDAMWSFDDIVKFQFIQKDKNNYLMKLQTKSNFSDEKKLRQRIQNILGNGIKLSVKYVDDIPPLQSGKRPYIINEYLKSKEKEASAEDASA